MVLPDPLRARLQSLGLIGTLALLPLVSRPDMTRQMGFFGAGMVCVAYAVFLVLWIFVLVWVYRDAEERGMNGILWVLVVFFLSIIGLIIYIVVREDKPAYPHGGYYQQQPYYPPPYQQQPYYQQPQYPPQQYPPQQPPPEPPRQYDPETGEYR